MDIEKNDRLVSFLIGKPYTGRYNWGNIFMVGFGHLTGPIGLYLMVTRAHWLTILSCLFFHEVGMIGATAGTHRLWCHRSFKANLPYRIMVMIMHSFTWQLDIVTWVRWHKCHHKWTDTNADPHNINRGFFYAHLGWLLVRPHPDYEAKQSQVDMSGVESDPVVAFQKKYYYTLTFLLAFISMAIPYFCWGETAAISFLQASFRWLLTAHVTYMANSLNHTNFGTKPYDSGITACTHKLSILIAGDGYHNFHHVFPSDYRTSAQDAAFNPVTNFIDFFAWIGWVTDRKCAPVELVQKKRLENLLD